MLSVIMSKLVRLPKKTVVPSLTASIFGAQWTHEIRQRILLPALSFSGPAGGRLRRLFDARHSDWLHRWFGTGFFGSDLELDWTIWTVVLKKFSLADIAEKVR